MVMESQKNLSVSVIASSPVILPVVVHVFTVPNSMDGFAQGRINI